MPEGRLPRLYWQGWGVLRDDKEAVQWFQKAASQGLDIAQTNLGSMYGQGRGVPLDYKTAAQWYLKAARQGFAKAQYNLGNLYARGQGVPKDPVQAYMWLQLAFKTTQDIVMRNQAARVQRGLASKMTKAQMTEAKRLAREWKSKK